MSKSKVVNKINFYTIFIISMLCGIFFGIIDVGGIQSIKYLNLNEMSAFIGNILGLLAGLLGLPFLVAFFVATIYRKLRGMQDLNLSYILVWFLFFILLAGAIAQIKPNTQIQSRLFNQGFHHGFIAACMNKAENQLPYMQPENARNYCQKLFIEIQPIINACKTQKYSQDQKTCLQTKISEFRKCINGKASDLAIENCVKTVV